MASVVEDSQSATSAGEFVSATTAPKKSDTEIDSSETTEISLETAGSSFEQTVSQIKAEEEKLSSSDGRAHCDSSSISESANQDAIFLPDQNLESPSPQQTASPPKIPPELPSAPVFMSDNSSGDTRTPPVLLNSGPQQPPVVSVAQGPLPNNTVPFFPNPFMVPFMGTGATGTALENDSGNSVNFENPPTSINSIPNHGYANPNYPPMPFGMAMAGDPSGAQLGPGMFPGSMFPPGMMSGMPPNSFSGSPAGVERLEGLAGGNSDPTTSSQIPFPGANNMYAYSPFLYQEMLRHYFQMMMGSGNINPSAELSRRFPGGLHQPPGAAPFAPQVAASVSPRDQSATSSTQQSSPSPHHNQSVSPAAGVPATTLSAANYPSASAGLLQMAFASTSNDYINRQSIIGASSNVRFDQGGAPVFVDSNRSLECGEQASEQPAEMAPGFRQRQYPAAFGAPYLPQMSAFQQSFLPEASGAHYSGLPGHAIGSYQQSQLAGCASDGQPDDCQASAEPDTAANLSPYRFTYPQHSSASSATQESHDIASYDSSLGTTLSLQSRPQVNVTELPFDKPRVAQQPDSDISKHDRNNDDDDDEPSTIDANASPKDSIDAHTEASLASVLPSELSTLAEKDLATEEELRANQSKLEEVMRRNPENTTMTLIRKQINEIEKEINRRMANQNIRKGDTVDWNAKSSAIVNSPFKENQSERKTLQELKSADSTSQSPQSANQTNMLFGSQHPGLLAGPRGVYPPPGGFLNNLAPAAYNPGMLNGAPAHLPGAGFPGHPAMFNSGVGVPGGALGVAQGYQQQANSSRPSSAGVPPSVPDPIVAHNPVTALQYPQHQVNSATLPLFFQQQLAGVISQVNPTNGQIVYSQNGGMPTNARPNPFTSEMIFPSGNECAVSEAGSGGSSVNYDAAAGELAGNVSVAQRLGSQHAANQLMQQQLRQSAANIGLKLAATNNSFDESLSGNVVPSSSSSPFDSQHPQHYQHFHRNNGNSSPTRNNPAEHRSSPSIANNNSHHQPAGYERSQRSGDHSVPNFGDEINLLRQQQIRRLAAAQQPLSDAVGHRPGSNQSASSAASHNGGGGNSSSYRDCQNNRTNVSNSNNLFLGDQQSSHQSNLASTAAEHRSSILAADVGRPRSASDSNDTPVWVYRDTFLQKSDKDSDNRTHSDGGECELKLRTSAEPGQQHDSDTDTETDRLLGQQRTGNLTKDDGGDEKQRKQKIKRKEVMIHEPAVLIEGVLFRANYLGSTQLVCEGRPTKATRMMQAHEAVSRIKEPEGEPQPSTEVDLFISTEKIMVLNTDLQDIMMDHPLRTISYIADIGDLVVLMARRISQPSSEIDEPTIKKLPKIICHIFESEEAQFIAQSIGQAFQVAYIEFLRQNGIEDPTYLRELDYQEVLNSQEIFGDELEMFSKKELQKDVVVPKAKNEPLGIVIVESGWGSMLPTVVIANLAPSGAAARSNQLNIGDQITTINGISLVGLQLAAAQQHIKNIKHLTAVKLNVVHTPPVVEVRIKRPDTKYQLGFSVQNGVICSLLRGGIAERGGVRVGHRIIEINGLSVVAVAHEKIVTMLATAVGEIQMKTMPTSMFRLLTGQEQPNYI